MNGSVIGPFGAGDRAFRAVIELEWAGEEMVKVISAKKKWDSKTNIEIQVGFKNRKKNEASPTCKVPWLLSTPRSAVAGDRAFEGR